MANPCLPDLAQIAEEEEEEDMGKVVRAAMPQLPYDPNYCIENDVPPIKTTCSVKHTYTVPLA